MSNSSFQMRSKYACFLLESFRNRLKGSRKRLSGVGSGVVYISKEVNVTGTVKYGGFEALLLIPSSSGGLLQIGSNLPWCWTFFSDKVQYVWKENPKRLKHIPITLLQTDVNNSVKCILNTYTCVYAYIERSFPLFLIGSIQEPCKIWKLNYKCIQDKERNRDIWNSTWKNTTPDQHLKHLNLHLK